MTRYTQRCVISGCGRADTTSADQAKWAAVLAGARGGRVERIDAQSRLALVAGLRALAQAGLAAPLGPRSGLIGATSTGSQAANEAFATELAVRGARLVSPHGFAQTLASTATGELAVVLDARGPMTTLVGTCAGLQAVDLAAGWLQSDADLERVLVVGFDVPTAAWEQSRTATLASAAPGSAKPAATVPPGRAVGLVLETESRAMARQAAIRGLLVGFAESFGEQALRRAVEGALGGPAPLQRLEVAAERDATGPLDDLVRHLEAPAVTAGSAPLHPTLAMARSALGPVSALAFRPHRGSGSSTF
jgi:3-oxoacyl-(acyl-carrier-protein) synthase